MLYNLIIAVGGMVALMGLYVLFDLLATRVRAVQADTEGDCSITSYKCLGCYVSGTCKSKRKQAPAARPRPGAAR
jgi:hypothetical protein